MQVEAHSEVSWLPHRGYPVRCRLLLSDQAGQRAAGGVGALQRGGEHPGHDPEPVPPL
ncbi:MAG: hypothetical protein ACOX87_14825 [Chloroflexota bacterium]